MHGSFAPLQRIWHGRANTGAKKRKLMAKNAQALVNAQPYGEEMGLQPDTGRAWLTLSI
jgi:hypothetical protein